MYKYNVICFNPRPHAEGDPRCSVGKSTTKKVSIHALTRRATRKSAPHGILQKFQSTPSRGGRLAKVRLMEYYKSFNPRPHAEGDQIEKQSKSLLERFNPRPHAEGDLAKSRNFRWITVSIHALTRRATHRDPNKSLANNVSIHALTRRATRSIVSKVVDFEFQSTPSRGGRRITLNFGTQSLEFQSTPSRGGRPSKSC